MSMHKATERDLRGESGGCTVKVQVLVDDGDRARVQVQDCGVYVRQGEIYEVPSSAVRMWWDEV